ncbi:hypothetical protein RJT34_15880 [Clitoria ternatea]|uniref:Uncharacterized protein n=1 Tax=Clitoria ternatea TaxID=43366 RepID=A0AAN9J680_CLITE
MISSLFSLKRVGSSPKRKGERSSEWESHSSGKAFRVTCLRVRSCRVNCQPVLSQRKNGADLSARGIAEYNTFEMPNGCFNRKHCRAKPLQLKQLRLSTSNRESFELVLSHPSDKSE